MRVPRRTTAVSVPLVCLLGLLPSKLLCQQMFFVSEVDTVRVWAADPELVAVQGTVISWTDSLAHLRRLSAPFDSIEIQVGHLTRLELMQRKSRGGSVAIGIGAGALLGTVLGAAIGESAVSGCGEFLCELEALNYAAGGLLFGALVGGLIAGLVPSEPWTEVPLSAVRPRFVARRDALGVLASVRF